MSNSYERPGWSQERRQDCILGGGGGDTSYLKIEEGGDIIWTLLFYFWWGHMTRGFVREKLMLGVLIISELLAGAYSLSIARGALSNGAEGG